MFGAGDAHGDRLNDGGREYAMLAQACDLTARQAMSLVGRVYIVTKQCAC
jgi:hypothetical protein